MVKVRKTEQLIPQLNSFKYNEEVFGMIMSDQTVYPLLDYEWLFITGTGKEDITVTLISNPHCSACAVAHKELEWVTARKDIRLQLIFAVTDYADEIVRHMMALLMEGNKQLIMEALSDWYEKKQKNRKDWIKKYPTKISFTDTQMLKLQSAWCETVKVDSTPTIFINGRTLPDKYSPNEIKYLF